ncbi:hypothetical protein AJ78_07335 [Emergomyces pasteurianus Ep9510]|uniref:Dynamin N-terminal domain-containing protein n=1 Tax=Emergomyces pasteurianus Ep9510 TaxID=1447872 RepID=A0A1J9PVU3_9EURO|nr:hypothetical protein AJ78_07335 [Emergomyces pasteurianus Ep9510]
MGSPPEPSPNGKLDNWTPSQDEEGSPDDKVLMNSSLKAFQSTEQHELLDLVDRLRRAGLSSILQLPQIVVCGDQSSGKSSALEAITEIPFPRRENLCTRFATEIIMRREVIRDFAELPSIIDDATKEMVLNEHKAFCKDFLSIEICGPNRPQLAQRNGSGENWFAAAARAKPRYTGAMCLLMIGQESHGGQAVSPSLP